MIDETFSLEDIAVHNTEGDCYMAHNSMVFDVTNSLERMEYLSAEDCGTDISGMLSEEQEQMFYGANIDKYVGVYIPTTQAQETSVRELNEPQNVELDTGSSYLILGSIFVAIVVLSAILISSLRKGKKKEVRKG